MTPPEIDLQTQLEERIGFETLLADLSARFVGLPAEALDHEIVEALRRICETLGFEQSSLGQPNKEGEPRFTHFWSLPGSSFSADFRPWEFFPWGTQQVLNGRKVQFTSVAELPTEAAVDKENICRVGLKSNLSLPLLVGGKPMGVLSFGTFKTERQWPENLVNRLRLLAEVFANALARRAAEGALRKALAAVEAMKERLEAENVSLRQDLQLSKVHPQILGRSAALRKVLALVEQVAPTDATVAVLGETGTGKELIAAAIHDLSPRHDRLMVRVNCAAIPSNLLENELFGREKGAYTGALSKQIGRFEAANGSTLFLDEIGELLPEVQVKLLRVLQEKQIERLGSSTPVPVNVRIIAATNLDWEHAVQTGKFRQDLFFRLNVVPITVPPLRDRAEDIPMLVRAFVNEFSKAMGKTIESIPQSNLDALQRYSWPGNIRELRNLVERAVILARGPKLIVEVPAIRQPGTHPLLPLKEVERAHILRVLDKTGWRVQGKGGAAEILGLNRSTLESRMAKLGIHRPKPGLTGD